MSINRHDFRVLFGIGLVVGGFTLAVATDLTLTGLRIATAAVAIATGVALLL